MSHLQSPWQEGIRNLLESHEVLEPVVNTLKWKDLKYTSFLFLSGITLYLLNEILGIGLMMVIGIVAICQILTFRFLKLLQHYKLAFSEVDLKEKFVVTPRPETVAIGVKVIGDFLRLVEERIKELAISKNYLELLQSLMFLIFTSAVGRLVSLPNLMLGLWVFTFTMLPIYEINEPFFDKAINSVQEMIALVSKRI